ncbi:ABC transporter substrate-binding protein [uncultured Cocleimonas sp.]|uniref:substrate-binding periplasmic protein n=1 Tax=uncultured Cocleimonas sp. TaxID=1051587 RepID=UPI00261E2C11|nr:transporter substrate-binding domain-containing protein [uncultured Cocleimonas sp.]
MNSFHKIIFLVVLSIASTITSSVASTSFADDKIVITHGDLGNSAFQLMAKPILEVAYSRIGKSVKFEKLPAERSLVYTNSGFSDGELARIAGLEEKYQNLTRISIPIAYDELSVYYKKPNLKVEGWSSLLPYNIGFVAGSKITEQKTEGMNVEMVSSATQGLNKVNLGRSDIFIGLKGIQCLIDKLKLTDIKVIDQPLEKLVMYHYVHKKHSQMARNLETVLRQMKESGEMDLLQKQSCQDFLDHCK